MSQFDYLPDAMDNKKSTFHGNPLLKRTHENVSLTAEHLAELKKCMDDPIYFAEHYVTIVNVDTGKQLIKLYPYQKRLLKGLHEHRQSIILSCRQSGKTTVTVAYLLYYILFNADKACCVLANKGAQAREIMSRIQLAYSNLPKWMQQGIVSYNKGSMELENGSSIFAAATSSDSVRGKSYACVTGDTIIQVYSEKEDKIISIPICDAERYEKVLTVDGLKRFNGVLKRTNRNHKIYITFSDGTVLKCTPDHKILVYHAFVEARFLIVGEKINSSLYVIKIEDVYDDEPVYDLIDVEDTHSYYTNGIVSHNCIFLDECIGGESMITVRDKETGEILYLPIKNFFELVQ